MSLPNSVPVKNRGCKHVNNTLALAQIQSSTGFAVRHYHNPVFNKSKGILLNDHITEYNTLSQMDKRKK